MTATKQDTRIKSFEQALEVTGDTKPDFSGMSEELKKHYEADFVWKTIIKALNKQRDPEWKCDFLNDDQYKYYPWSWLKKDESKPTGFAFSLTYYHFTRTFTYVGSRLCVSTSEKAIDIGKRHIKLFVQWKLILKPTKKSK